jgi:hypothetical protein
MLFRKKQAILIIFKLKSSGLWRRVVLRYDTNVSEDLAASILMVKYSASYRNTTRLQIPDDIGMNLHRRECLKSHAINN